MKKLSLLVALIMAVTVGGVYATWNYAHGNVQPQTKYLDSVTVVAPMVETTAKGTITVDTSDLSIVIDDKNNDFNGELVITGDATVTFTPNDGASADIASNGIKMQYALSTTDNFKYNNADIFNVTTTANQTDNATKSFTITAETLADLIKLNSLTLPTAAEYEAFKNALHSGSIIITVSEVTQ